MRPYRAVPRTALSGSPDGRPETTAPAAASKWESDFQQALRRGDPLAASTVLRATGEHGRVGRAQLERASALVDGAGVASIVRRDWAIRLLAHPRRADKGLAALLLAPLVASHPAEVERAVLRLARDDRWDVRDAAAALLGRGLDAVFDRYVRTCRSWMDREDARVRRAVVAAAKHAARSRAPDRAERLLDLVEPALREREQYVRRSVGAFAIGDQLLRSYPDETLARLERWALDPDETVRWNVAMAFSSAAGAKHAERGLPILRELARDHSRSVVRAANATLRRIARRRPDLAGDSA